MADIVKDATDYRIKQIEIAEEKYYKTLIATLDRIEQEVTALANKDLPQTDGRLIELQAAIAIRPKIKAIIDREYLAWSDTVVREGFTKQAKRVEKAFKTIGRIPVEFQQLTNADLTLITNLKRQSFTQFKDVSNTFTRKLSEKIYQSTLTSVEFVELEDDLRKTINGIYASSKDEDINRLVKNIKKDEVRLRKLRRNSIKAKQIRQKLDLNVQTLQSKFGRDRAGDNMRKYASQLLNDGLREFDAQVNAYKSQEAGLTHVKYFGDIIPTTREVCKNILRGVYKKRQSNVFTIDEVRKLWRQRSWSGKKPGDPLVVRGGYNCRHQWTYVSPDWYDSEGNLII